MSFPTTLCMNNDIELQFEKYVTSYLYAYCFRKVLCMSQYVYTPRTGIMGTTTTLVPSNDVALGQQLGSEVPHEMKIMCPEL